ncbi:MAG: magnesium/cobalt transporter CorA [Bacteroidetes bacterium]|nr:magnesium/cobalt transporter CorA [Bacteroidota bacterium]
MALRRKKKNIRHSDMAAPPSQSTVTIKVFSYTATQIFENTFTDFPSLKNYLEKDKELEHWIDVVGKSDKNFFAELARYFKLHELVLEDILATDQRSKVDELENCLLIISRMIYFDKSEQLINEQVSFLVFQRVLITVQDEWDDCFEKIREMLRKNRLNVRQEASFYLAQMLLGSIIDHYFPMLDIIADQLDQLEEDLLKNPSPDTTNRIQALKRTLIFLRKFIRPERDVINHLLTLNHASIREPNKMYLRDIYDHCVQVNDTVESYRDIAYSLMDVYLSSIGNRTNEVMKVLTVISAIFIPLTFIAGVYGMNFDTMPELHSENGYYFIWGFMLLVGIGEIIYFQRKGWL